jgi:hypothetical protein
LFPVVLALGSPYVRAADGSVGTAHLPGRHGSTILTANPFYKLNGASVGLPIKTAAKHLKIGKAIVIGLDDWYVASGTGPSNRVFKVRHGVIQEIGIASKAMTAAPFEQRKFLSSFRV